MYRKAYVLLPALVSLIVGLAACLPWGAAVPVEYALPLITMAVIYYWTVRRPDQLPSPLVFLIGLFTDLATAGPLGFWAFNFLIAVTIASYALPRFADKRDPLAVAAFFALTVVVVSLTGWALSSLFFLRAAPLQPVLLGAGLAILAYPVVSFVLSPLNAAVGHALHAAGLREDDYA